MYFYVSHTNKSLLSMYSSTHSYTLQPVNKKNVMIWTFIGRSYVAKVVKSFKEKKSNNEIKILQNDVHGKLLIVQSSIVVVVTLDSRIFVIIHILRTLPLLVTKASAHELNRLCCTSPLNNNKAQWNSRSNEMLQKY